jgi:steroid 5-alpha reductase family enzyme
MRDYASLGLFAASFMLEVVADNQKSSWRCAKDKKLHNEKFITGGLWSISRHPKYVYVPRIITRF